MRPNDPRITSTVALVAAAVWLGGLLSLGAIVAPVVFTMIPRPEAADAMTVVFQRFDFVAMACVGLLLVTEAWRAAGQRKIRRLDVVRMAAAVAGGALVLVESVWITPAIVALHRAGALRGLGANGMELDRMHSLAETCGKTQVVFALAVIALHVFTVRETVDEGGEPNATAIEDAMADARAKGAGGATAQAGPDATSNTTSNTTSTSTSTSTPTPTPTPTSTPTSTSTSTPTATSNTTATPLGVAAGGARGA